MSHYAADRLLLWTVWRGLHWNVLLIVLALASAAGSLLLPTTLATAVDQRIGQVPGSDALWQLPAVVVLLVASEVGVLLFTPWCTAIATARLRTWFLDHVLRLDTVDRGRFPEGDLTSRVTAAATETGTVAPLLGQFFATLSVAGGALIALWWIDYRLAVAFLAGVPLGLVLMKVFLGTVSPLLTDYLAIQGRIAGRLVEVLAGIRTVRSAGTERWESDRVLAELPDLHEAGRRMWLAQGRVNWQAGLLAPLMQVLVLATAGYILHQGGMTPGQMLAASGYALLALGFFQNISVLMGLARARAGARRLLDVTAREPMAYGRSPLPDGPGTLRLRSVTVTGEAGTLLDGIDLDVPGGSTVAVVGGAGAGKSTLAAVCGRLLDPGAGSVRLDGAELRSLPAQTLRDAVGWAFERPEYLGSSIADTIRLGNGELSEGEVVHAARLAQADGFIRRLPDGYATPAAKAPLSGGELQRLGLARAMAHRGRLLILDDATSSLDSVTEYQVSSVLDGPLRDRTQIVLAHRVSSAARADLVVWLEKGRVRAAAPHDELWFDPDYRSLFEAPVGSTPAEPPRAEDGASAEAVHAGGSSPGAPDARKPLHAQ